VLEEFRALREATMSTEFSAPEDTQWDERPRSGASFATRTTGWIVAAIWAVLVAAFMVWQLWQGTAGIVERMLVFGGLSAFALLFVSVLLDRINAARTDPYREVEK